MRGFSKALVLLFALSIAIVAVPMTADSVLVTGAASASFHLDTLIKVTSEAELRLGDCADAPTVQLHPGSYLLGVAYGKNCSGDSFPFSVARLHLISGSAKVQQEATFTAAGAPAFFALDPLDTDLADGPATIDLLRNDGNSRRADVAVWNASDLETTVYVGNKRCDLDPHSFLLVPVDAEFDVGSIDVWEPLWPTYKPSVYVVAFVNGVNGGSPRVRYASRAVAQ